MKSKGKRIKYTSLTFSPSSGSYSMKANVFNSIPAIPPSLNDLQTCTRCKKEQTLKHFQRYIVGKNGRVSICNTCRNKTNTKHNKRKKRKNLFI